MHKTYHRNIEIIRHHDNGLTPLEIVQKMGLGYKVVSGVLEREAKRRRGGTKAKIEPWHATVIRLSKQGMSAIEIAEKLNRGHSSVTDLLRRHRNDYVNPVDRKAAELRRQIPHDTRSPAARFLGEPIPGDPRRRQWGNSEPTETKRISLGGPKL